ncbi:hypothetical protein AB8W27_15195 [Cronobacter turicensis]|uniref:Ead/Ea22-like family protein n=1 Tax=Cronobacter turicensis (strain DSM 18703 / CCUG 55852 / LMG 23827 / z3032) TaxID=693216 RepID=C9XXZ0_CROTZ|nr:hypothetical protein [Cronobacter turicensis]MDI6470679.1 hypothetical protein [Cronobacter turicensis]CBA28850.1 unknown protein [Cronobacter turicensis z3032]
MKTEGTQNNDELIAAGHELAKCLDNEPLIDIAKMLSKMATQLDVTTAALREKTKQCEQLAAENAALNNRMQKLIQIINNADNSYCMCGEAMETHAHGGCGHPTGMFDYHYNAWLEADTETPATDAFLREVRASAVDAVCLKISNSIVSCRQDEMIGLDEAVNIASDFAVELRQGGAA